MMKIAVLAVSFMILFGLTICIDYVLGVLTHKYDEEVDEPETKNSILIRWIRKLNLKRIFIILMDIVISFLIALPFNFDSKIQDEYNYFVHWLSGDIKIEPIIQKSKDIGKELLQEQKIQKSAADTRDKIMEPLQEFPFSIEYDITFPETKVLEVPVLRDSDDYSVILPIELYEYQHEKVPINEDIHGFIVNDTYYCNDDDSETSITGYNYYNFADYWLVLHTVEISFRGSGDFTPDFNGATIMLREKESQKAVIIENSYLANSFVTFECSTGQYIIEIHKNGIAYTSDIFIDENEKAFIGIAERDHYYLPEE